MIRINLLPRKAKPLITLWRDGSVLGATVVLLLIVWMVVLVRMNSRLNTTRRELQKVKKQIEDSKLDLQKVEQLKERKAMLENKINIIHSLREKQAGPVHMLDDLSLAIPEQVWLEGINNTGTTIRIDGYSPSYNAVSEFMRTLAQSPYYDKIELDNIQQSLIKGKKFQRFKVSCEVLFIPKIEEKAPEEAKEQAT